MRILHCCLACFYIDNYSYQENILPRYHKLMGHEVKIVASTESFDKNGRITYIDAKRYMNEDGIEVVRLPYVTYIPDKAVKKLRRYKGLWEELNSFKPDFIFIHDIQFLDIDIIRKYAKKHTVKIVADCHADFSNSARNFISRKVLHGIVYKHCAHLIEPYVTKFYGVLPARVDFLKNVYKLPENKVDLLVMGSEDVKAEASMNKERISSNRLSHGVQQKDFLIVFGGKIDKYKTQVLMLMDAVNTMPDLSVKLVVFGSIVPDMKEAVEKRCSDRVKYLGWATTDQSYDYFGMADVVCFPGRHSVYWEQVAGMGIPLIVKRWDGTTHVDVGGNVLFLESDGVEEIQNAIKQVKNSYASYKAAAVQGKDTFMYSKIAERCIGC